MLPRLQMMKAMLKPQGVIAICIDDNELFDLGLMMDEVLPVRPTFTTSSTGHAWPASHGKRAFG